MAKGALSLVSFPTDHHHSFALVGRQEEDAVAFKSPPDLIARGLIHLETA